MIPSPGRAVFVPRAWFALGLGVVALLAPPTRGPAAAAGDEATAVRFAILGDRTGGAQPGIYEAIVAEVQRLRPDFVITVGDMIEGPAPDSLTLEARWDEYDRIVAPLTMPLYFVPGNNDIWDDLSERVYRRRVGPIRYSFSRDGLHFAILDASRWFASDDLPPEQWAWLRQDLAEHRDARATFVFLHVPYWYDGVAAGQPDTLHAICRRFGVDAVFSGHFHDYFCEAYDGIRYTGIGSSGGQASPSPHGWTYHYAWVTVDREGVHIAPIKYGSVMAWEEMSATARRTLRTARQSAIGMLTALAVSPDLHVAAGEIAVRIDNSFSAQPLADTLHWEIPDGWSLDPAWSPLNLDPGLALTLQVRASCDGALYPLPTACLRFPFAPGETEELRCPLRIAREAPCLPAPTPPQIDGALEESCWREPVERLFCLPGRPADVEETAFFFAYDPANLYLAVRCRDRAPDSLHAQATERDGPVYADDCVGYFIEAQNGSGIVYQIYFSARGAIFDQKIWRTAAGYLTADTDWDGEYAVTAACDDAGWSIEARLPVAQLGAAPAPGTAWRINFRRKQQRLSAVGDWQVPIDYDPDTYGRLRFR